MCEQQRVIGEERASFDQSKMLLCEQENEKRTNRDRLHCLIDRQLSLTQHNFELCCKLSLRDDHCMAVSTAFTGSQLTLPRSLCTASIGESWSQRQCMSGEIVANSLDGSHSEALPLAG